MGFLIFCIIPIVLGLIGSAIANHSLKKYKQYRFSTGHSAAQIVQMMLSANNCQQIPIKHGGQNDDFFNPKDNSITLSSGNYGGSITDIAVAAHETGHACQFQQSYGLLKFRNFLVVPVNVASAIWPIAIILGIFFKSFNICMVGAIVFGLILLFQLVTLPVEFNASKRGIQFLSTITNNQQELGAAKSILRACAFTYVIAALISIMQFIWMFLGSRN